MARKKKQDEKLDPQPPRKIRKAGLPEFLAARLTMGI